jgi:hypothetical protein
MNPPERLRRLFIFGHHSIYRCNAFLRVCARLKEQFMTIPNLEKYIATLKEEGLSHEECEVTAQSLWLIMQAFADKAWGMHPTQQAELDGSSTRDFALASSLETSLQKSGETNKLNLIPNFSEIA